MTPPTHPATVVSVTTEGLPDAYRDGDHIIVEITPPNPPGGTEAIVRIPLADAPAWAAEAYVAVMAAWREATGAEIPAIEITHAGLIVTGHLAGTDRTTSRIIDALETPT